MKAFGEFPTLEKSPDLVLSATMVEMMSNIPIHDEEEEEDQVADALVGKQATYGSTDETDVHVEVDLGDDDEALLKDKKRSSSMDQYGKW